MVSKRKMIMVVDDEVDFLEEIAETLNLSGYEACVYQSGEHALRAWETVKPDIVFLDLKMEGMSGFEVAREMRKKEKGKSIPIYAMTGYYTDKQFKNLVEEIGVEECLTKPVKPLDLIARIEMKSHI